jgi:hypothetical protein
VAEAEISPRNNSKEENQGETKMVEWTADAKKCANHYVQGFPPFPLSQYKSWLSKIAALQNDFDAASVGK